MTEPQTPLWLRRSVLAGLLGGLLLAGFVVMQPFMAAIAWAAILTYVSWPLHLRVLAWLGGRRTWAALVMTLVLTLVLGLSLLWAGLLLRSEGLAAVRQDTAWGYISPSGKMEIAPQFLVAQEFSGGLAYVTFRGGWGYVNRAGKLVWKSEIVGVSAESSEGEE